MDKEPGKEICSTAHYKRMNYPIVGVSSNYVDNELTYNQLFANCYQLTVPYPIIMNKQITAKDI